MELKALYLLVTETHLPPCVSRNVHATQENLLFVGVCIRIDNRVSMVVSIVLDCQSSHQLGLDRSMILLVDDIINAVSVNEKVLLKQNKNPFQIRSSVDFLTLQAFVVLLLNLMVFLEGVKRVHTKLDLVEKLDF